MLRRNTCDRRLEGERVVVRHGLRRRAGADYADLPGAARGHRPPGRGEDHLDHRHGIPLPRITQDTQDVLVSALANMNASYGVTHRYSDESSLHEVPSNAYLAASFV